MKRSIFIILSSLYILLLGLLWATFSFFYVFTSLNNFSRPIETAIGSLFLLMSILSALLLPGIWNARSQWLQRGRLFSIMSLSLSATVTFVDLFVVKGVGNFGGVMMLSIFLYVMLTSENNSRISQSNRKTD